MVWKENWAAPIFPAGVRAPIIRNKTKPPGARSRVLASPGVV